MKKDNKKGFISIEHLIVGATMIIAGYFILMWAQDYYLAISQKRLGVFEVDSQGYDVSLNVNPSEINKLSDFTISYNSALGGYSISDYINAIDKTVVIPAFHEDGRPFVEIQANAFSQKAIISVVLPNSIKVIRSRAFYANQIISVGMSRNIALIDSEAFAYNELTEIAIPLSVQHLGNQVFYQNKLERVDFFGPVPLTLGNSIFSSNPLLSASIRVAGGYLPNYQDRTMEFGVDSSAFIGR